MIEASTNYKRSFIILDESNGTYRADNKKVSTGFVKIEQKGKKVSLCVYVQNIKVGTYSVWGICKTQSEVRMIKFGDISVEGAAKAEICFDASPEMLCKMHNGINELSGIVLLDEGNNKVFEGFQNGKISYNLNEALRTFEENEDAVFSNAKASVKKQETLNSKEPVKKVIPQTKTEAIKKSVPETKTESIKQVKPQKPAEPVKQTAPEKKVEPIKQVVPEKKVEPIKQVVPEKKVEPIKQVVPEKKVEPIKQVVPEKKIESVKQVVPEKKVEPIKQVVPEQKVEPIKQVVPEQKVEPIKQAVPEQKVEPIKQVVPEKPAEPIKQIMPERPVEPTKQIKPEIIKNIEMENQAEPKIEMDVQIEIESYMENIYGINNYEAGEKEEPKTHHDHSEEKKQEHHDRCEEKKQEHHDHCEEKKQEHHDRCNEKRHQQENLNENDPNDEREIQDRKHERKSNVLNALYGSKGKNEIIYLPFEQANRNIKWRKKSLVNISSNYVLKVMSIPYIYNMCSIYGHYVVGYGEKSITVGVPARYSDTYNYMIKYKSIAQWVKMSESLPSYGYWLFEIDKRTGEILYSA